VIICSVSAAESGDANALLGEVLVGTEHATDAWLRLLERSEGHVDQAWARGSPSRSCSVTPSPSRGRSREARNSRSWLVVQCRALIGALMAGLSSGLSNERAILNEGFGDMLNIRLLLEFRRVTGAVILSWADYWAI
jgi:hypothetical protein